MQAARVLKQEMGYTTPIVALTAETGSDVRERCKAGRCNFKGLERA